MNRIKICAVVVTYNRLNLLKKSILALREQERPLEAIIVVNNSSTDNTLEWLNEQKDLIVITQPNLGGAAGFSKGIETAFANNYDWIWVMDDDAFAKPNACIELENAIKRHSYNQNISFWSNPDDDYSFQDDEKEVRHAMFVGWAFSSLIVKTIGLPRSDFFIYWDDFEYSHRMIKSGFKIYKLKNSIIEHRALSENEFYSKNFLKTNITFHKMSDFKLYYFFRNRLLMYDFFSKAWIFAFKESVVEFLKVIFLSHQGRIAFEGIYDGLLRKSGKRDFK